MESRWIALAAAMASGTALALPPALGPTSVTTNLAVGVVAEPDVASGSTRITVINNPDGGQIVGGSPSRALDMACPSLVACYGQAASSGAFANAPFASATASASLNGTVPDWVQIPLNGAGVGALANNTMQYQLAVAGPANTTALVHLASYLQLAGSSVGASVSAFTGFSVDGSGDRWVSTFLYSSLGLSRLTRDANGNPVGGGYQPGPASGVWIEDEIVPLAANAVYTVSLYANASAGVAVHAGGNAGQGSISAFVDPQFTIDPTTPNAGAYAILLSDGVGNAEPLPEPAPAALWACGLFVLGGWRLRRGQGRRDGRPRRR